jgi:SnoaL-like domain
MSINLTSAELQAEIERFYAWHMQLLDNGKVDEWAAAFTPDGAFADDAHPEPIRGRENIQVASRQVAGRLAEAGIMRRHWLGMSHVMPEAGAVRVQSYALVLETTKGESVTLRASTTCDDVLVPDGSSWLIRERVVHVDGV